MKKKLPWLRYDMKQAEYREAKEHENDAAKALEEAAKLLNVLKEPLRYGGLSYFYTSLFKFLILFLVFLVVGCEGCLYFSMAWYWGSAVLIKLLPWWSFLIHRCKRVSYFKFTETPVKERKCLVLF